MIHIAKRLAITTDDLIWMDPDGEEKILRRGFPSDGASLPWIAQLKWDPWDPVILPEALLHDGGYTLQKTEFALGGKAVVDRRFYNGMYVAGFRAKRTFWRTVQVAGWPAWWKPNNKYVEGYLCALRNNTLDEWIESFRKIPGEENPCSSA